jgi:hypothetical protein
MLQRGLGIVVEKIARRDQMTRDEIRGVSIESGQFTAYLGRQLTSLDVRRQLGSGDFRRRASVVFGLGATSAIRPRRTRSRPLPTPLAASPTATAVARSVARSTTLAARSVVDH